MRRYEHAALRARSRLRRRRRSFATRCSHKLAMPLARQTLAHAGAHSGRDTSRDLAAADPPEETRLAGTAHGLTRMPNAGGAQAEHKLTGGLQALGLAPEPERSRACSNSLSLLAKWNRAYNLTGIARFAGDGLPPPAGQPGASRRTCADSASSTSAAGAACRGYRSRSGFRNASSTCSTATARRSASCHAGQGGDSRSPNVTAHSQRRAEDWLARCAGLRLACYQPRLRFSLRGDGPRQLRAPARARRRCLLALKGACLGTRMEVAVAGTP